VALNLPNSTGWGAIWKLPGVKNSSGSDEYLANVNATMFKNRDERSFRYGEINSSITPINKIVGKYFTLRTN
jgi:hypothetical protein